MFLSFFGLRGVDVLRENHRTESTKKPIKKYSEARSRKIWTAKINGLSI